MMRIVDLLKSMKKGEGYEITTLWREMPVKTKGVLLSIDLKESIIDLDLSKCKFRELFVGKDIYLKFSQEHYLRGSALKLEKGTVLQVLAKSLEKPPPFVLRRFLRIIPPPDERVMVSICIEEKECILDAPALDISEGGLGVVLDKEKATLLLGDLKGQTEEECKRPEVSIHVKLPLEGALNLRAEIRNINIEGQVVRVGMKYLLKSEDEVEPIRRFIIRVQKKLLESFIQ